MEIRQRKYFKYRYGNRLYTRRQARGLGKTSLTEGGRDLYVSNGRGWHTFMHLQECAWGQKYVEDDKYLRDRDRFIKTIKESGSSD